MCIFVSYEKAVESSRKKTWKEIPTDSLSQSDKESIVSEIVKIFYPSKRLQVKIKVILRKGISPK